FADRFLKPVTDLVAHGVRNTVSAVDARIDEAGENPFDIPLQVFLRRSIKEKDELTRRAAQLSRPVLDRAFAAGKGWVLLCGNPGDIRVSASSLDEVLNEQQVMGFARIQNRAPFQFWRPLDVDDVAWASCSSRLDLVDYPTVTLEFPGESLTAHFDTGAPITF